MCCKEVMPKNMSLNCCAFDAEFITDDTGQVRFLTISVSKYNPKDGSIENVTFAPGAGDAMTAEEVEAAVRFIFQLYKNKNVVVSWSGADSDWRHMHSCVASDEAKSICAFLAMKHVDLAHLLLCDKGYMTGLDVVASNTLRKEKPMPSSDGSLCSIRVKIPSVTTSMRVVLQTLASPRIR